MPKQFGQMGLAGKGIGADPTKMGLPGETPAIFTDHGPPMDVSEHAKPPIDDGGTYTPDISTHQPEEVRKRKKIDWKGMIQNGLNGASDDGEEDPLAILQMHQGNQNSYLNPRTY